jgi:hypothetical protein
MVTTTTKGKDRASGPVENLEEDEEGESLMRAYSSGPAELEARLLHSPRSLHDHWKEFKFGYCRCKPTQKWKVFIETREKNKTIIENRAEEHTIAVIKNSSWLLKIRHRVKIMPII